ncbi:MAG: EFR1 family ferrodoxin [Lachnospiraceae bacterium]|nr:EFR1 family ferrodoxin [Lachnospiraceae bacterium]
MIAVYFSGTGNSRYAAELFAEKMQCKSISIEEQCDFDLLMQEASEIAFFFPIYGSCPPIIMRKFVQIHKKALQGKKLLLFCTQAMASGDGARSLLDELNGISYEVIYAEHFIMPGNICNMRIPALPKAVYRKLTQRKIRKIHADLMRRKYKRKGFHWLSIMLGNAQRIPFQKKEKEYAASIQISDTCIGCKKCIRSCPAGNLFFEDGRVKAKAQCTLCYRCMNGCPQKAITNWIQKPVKKQYRGIFSERIS